jgi:hypothetical protein
MSVCTPGTCPHDRDVFVWKADGEWREDPADPNFGKFPWVHSTTMDPGHLEVCDLKPFATAEECGELCACGCSSSQHKAGPGGIPPGMLSNPRRCPCGCPDFEHRAEDIARWREERAIGGRTSAGEDEQRARLSEGRSVPGGPGACAREGCAHLTLWHERKGKFRACRKCPCPAFTGEAGQVMPDVQLELFADEPAALRPGRPARAAEIVRVSGGVL